jgi:hypothetical protein
MLWRRMPQKRAAGFHSADACAASVYDDAGHEFWLEHATAHQCCDGYGCTAHDGSGPAYGHVVAGFRRQAHGYDAHLSKHGKRRDFRTEWPYFVQYQPGSRNDVRFASCRYGACDEGYGSGYAGHDLRLVSAAAGIPIVGLDSFLEQPPGHTGARDAVE